VDLAEAARSLDMERDDHAITKGKYSILCCLVEVVEDLQLPKPDKHESELLYLPFVIAWSSPTTSSPSL
jgi:hypothetical protein